MPIERQLIERLYRRANEKGWGAPIDRFAEALEASVGRAFPGSDQSPQQTPGEIERHLRSLHLEDLALACACAAGDEAAWEHFVLRHRPILYRAADALDPSGGARDLADSLYADLFGLRHRAGERQSLFRYFHGRSSLATWLHAVLAQRYVDRLRRERVLEALPDEESPSALRAAVRAVDPDRNRHLSLIREAMGSAVASLEPRDRLRLTCYYAQELTLAQTGRLLGEHEATSSRQLARTRQAIRAAVERQLRFDAGLTDAEISHCFASVSADAGSLDLRQMLGDGAGRKEAAPDRSNEGPPRPARRILADDEPST